MSSVMVMDELVVPPTVSASLTRWTAGHTAITGQRTGAGQRGMDGVT